MSLKLLLGVAAVLSVSAGLSAHASSGLAQVAVPQDLTLAARVPVQPAPVATLIAAPRKKNLYAKLFRTADVSRGDRAAAPAQPAKPKRGCGMTMLPADPSVDPGIQVPVPAGDVGFTIRRITPPACRE